MWGCIWEVTGDKAGEQGKESPAHLELQGPGPWHCPAPATSQPKAGLHSCVSPGLGARGHLVLPQVPINHCHQPVMLAARGECVETDWSRWIPGHPRLCSWICPVGRWGGLIRMTGSHTGWPHCILEKGASVWQTRGFGFSVSSGASLTVLIQPVHDHNAETWLQIKKIYFLH